MARFRMGRGSKAAAALQRQRISPTLRGVMRRLITSIVPAAREPLNLGAFLRISGKRGGRAGAPIPITVGQLRASQRRAAFVALSPRPQAVRESKLAMVHRAKKRLQEDMT